jgi:hypothetical protein
MKRLISFVLIAAAVCAPMSGSQYRGTISVTFDYAFTMHDADGSSWEPGIAGVSVGDTFSGWYEYDSSTADGVFSPSSMEGSLNGAISMPGLLFTGSSGLLGFTQHPYLCVTNDQVTSFSWGLTWGPTDANFVGSGWNLGTSRIAPTGDRYQAGGDLFFGGPTPVDPTPIDPPTAVPESGSVLLLLAGALIGLVFFGTLTGSAKNGRCGLGSF